MSFNTHIEKKLIKFKVGKKRKIHPVFTKLVIAIGTV